MSDVKCSFTLFQIIYYSKLIKSNKHKDRCEKYKMKTYETLPQVERKKLKQNTKKSFMTNSKHDITIIKCLYKSPVDRDTN